MAGELEQRLRLGAFERLHAGWTGRFGEWLRSPWFRGVVLPLLATVLGLKLLAPLCFTYVGPNEHGIKVVQIPITGSRGVHEDVYETGYHFVLRPFGIERMFLFPKDVQVLDLAGTREDPAAAREVRVTKAAHRSTARSASPRTAHPDG